MHESTNIHIEHHSTLKATVALLVQSPFVRKGTFSRISQLSGTFSADDSRSRTSTKFLEGLYAMQEDHQLEQTNQRSD
jgi:hypothetical protein